MKTKTLRPVADNISNAFSSFEKNARTYVLIALYALLPSFVYQIFQTTLKFNGQEKSAETWVLVSILLIMTLNIVMAVSGHIALIKATDSTSTNTKKISEYISESFSSFWPLIWTGIVTTILILIGFIAIIIPGIVLAIYLSLAYYTCVLEKKSGWQAVKESMKKIDGAWWKVLGRYLVLFIMIIGAMILLSVISFSLQNTIDTLASTIIFQILYMLAMLVITPVSVIYSWQIYKDLSK